MPEPAATPLRHLRRLNRRRRKLIRSTARVAAVTLAATALLILGTVSAWKSYAEWQLGHIELTNDGPILKVQVCDETGERPIGEPVDLVTNTALTLPDGDYRLRVNGVGRLGRMYRFAVNRGETIAYALSLDEGRLLGGDPYPWNGAGDKPREEPMPYALVARALELTPGKSDIVEFTGQAVIRRDGASGKPVWDTANPSPSTPYDPGRDPGRWLRGTSPSRWGLRFIEPAIDVDGDGTRDLIVVVLKDTAFIALSGKDGSVLWSHAATLDGPGAKQSVPGPLEPPSRPSSLIGRPAIGDVDGDGAPDLIATMIFQEFPTEAAQRLGKPPGPTTPILSRRVVLAISGRSGRLLWIYPLDKTFTNVSSPFGDRPAALVCGRQSATVAILDGWEWIALDPATGRPRSGPLDLGFVPVRPIQYADLDGDGEPEILALGPGPAAKQQSLAVFTSGTSQPRWTATIRAPYGQTNNWSLTVDWPWLVDLDGDGRAELVVPESVPMPPQAGFRGVQVLDGASGRTRWVRPMRPETKAEDGLNHVLEAPDLDGDGVRDLIAVSGFDGRNPPASRLERRYEPQRVYVDALSGRDGHPLWSWHADLAENKVNYIWAPRWWGRGPDGWPILAVPVGGKNLEGGDWSAQSAVFHPPVVYVLEAATGRLLHEAQGLSEAGVADLDGDGLTDLWGEAAGQLRAFRGEPPEAWRALGQFGPASKGDSPWGGNIERAATDLDGDGVADTLSGRLYVPGDSETDQRGSRTAIARSGRDGHVLWKTVLDPPLFFFEPEHGRSYSLAAFPLPAGDLDGDGTPDVLLQKYTNDEAEIGGRLATLPIQVLSGRDGRPLWSAGPLPLGFEAHGYSQVTWAEPRIMEPNAPPDLVVHHSNPLLKAGSKPSPWGPTQERLARVSGRTGRILWDLPLEDQPSQHGRGANPVSPRPRVEDVDGDGGLDAVMIFRRDSQSGQADFELRAISLRNGATLWSRVLHYQGDVVGFPHIEIGKRKKDERATVFVYEEPSTKTSNELVVYALDGRDGADRWTWRSGVGESDRRLQGDIDPIALDGPEKDAICVTYSNHRRETRILILDALGQERVRRVLPPAPVPQNYFPPVLDWMIDLDGDGRDELLVWHDDRLYAWGSDLKDLWSGPAARAFPSIRFLRASQGRPSTLLITPATAIDGISGQVRWSYKLSATWGNRYAGSLLDPGDSSRLPLLVASNLPATICRYALPTTPGGDYLPPAGARVPPGPARDDPRWTRPLPWTEPIVRTIGLRGFLGLGALALVNVLVPIAILRLASRRRGWSVRSLMALPVAAAVPLIIFRTTESLIPAQIGPLAASTRLLFTLGTIAGIPLLTYSFLAGWSLVRRRWKPLAPLAASTVLATAIVAAAWLWIDSRAMPTIEHYERSNWYLAVIPGAYVIGILLPVGCIVRRIHRGILREDALEPEP